LRSNGDVYPAYTESDSMLYHGRPGPEYDATCWRALHKSPGSHLVLAAIPFRAERVV